MDFKDYWGKFLDFLGDCAWVIFDLVLGRYLHYDRYLRALEVVE